MTTIYLYVLPMLLGRTYDIKTDSPGVDIFPQAAIDGATMIERSFTDARYRMVSDSREARDFLGVSGDLSLKIKSGRVNIEGLGSYLKDTRSRANAVEILVKVHYETRTYTLPSSALPRPEWRTLDQRGGGGATHYVRSMTYGGDLVASLRFSSRNAHDRERIRAAVQAELQADSGSFGLGIEGNFSRLQEQLKDTSSLEINYYATVPIKGVPNTMESLMELVESFPKETQKVNKGIGVPLTMELFPLSALDADLPRFLDSKALTDQLDRLESEFDDLLSSKKSLQEWMLNVPPVLPPEIEEEVGAFHDQLERASLVFYRVMGDMDYGEGGVGKFQDAFDAYADGGTRLPDKYYRRLTKLKHAIIQSSQALSLDVGGAVFTHWGRSECGGEGVQKMFSGVIASTDQVKGGSADIICLAQDPHVEPDTAPYKRHHRYYSKLVPTLLDRNFTSPVGCALCFAAERTSPTTFPGRTQCPSEWTHEYSGFVAAKDMRSRKGALTCVDAAAEESEVEVLLVGRGERSDRLRDVRRGDARMPCVVCTY